MYDLFMPDKYPSTVRRAAHKLIKLFTVGLAYSSRHILRDISLSLSHLPTNALLKNVSFPLSPTMEKTGRLNTFRTRTLRREQYVVPIVWLVCNVKRGQQRRRKGSCGRELRRPLWVGTALGSFQVQQSRNLIAVRVSRTAYILLCSCKTILHAA